MCRPTARVRKYRPMTTAPQIAPPTPARILDGRRVADQLLDELKVRVDARLAAGRSRPGLAAFNTDGYSETLNTAALTAQYTADMQAAADIYLPRSHPLRYAGRDGRCGPCTAVTRP